jgi:hypothetical protein
VRRRWSLRLVTGLAVTTALVGGCSSKQEANDTLPSAAETSSSPALQPLGPPDFPVPDEARTQDAAGAEAALRYYLALVTHQQAKDGQPLRDLSRDCDFCNFLAARADEDAAAGYTFKGGDIAVEDMSPPALHKGLAEFAFSAGQSAVVVVGADGQPVPGRGEAKLSGLSGAAAMTWSNDLSAWLMTQLSFRQP